MLVTNFNLEKSLTCGQCFHFEKKDDGYIIYGEDSVCFAKQDKMNLNIKSNNNDYWIHYFSLNENYTKINNYLMSHCNNNNDNFGLRSIIYGSGIRILKQPLFETCCSYIISQQNNIPRIQKTIFKISETFSTKIDVFDGKEYRLFPSYEDLKKCTIEDFKSLGLGYRAEYLYLFIQNWPEIEKEILSINTFEQHFEILTRQRGIGKKVANCICLYGLGHINAFPIDTWIQKVIDEEYNGKIILPSCYSGIFQQYIFYTKRNK